ncbi:hypothetical protein P7H22_00050 [Paenibacillus larvae]|nr:hypothetical protein [Paenibacillus larvae]MDT2239106.1 hypothetical protein [Paenibacillus larvae]
MKKGNINVRISCNVGKSPQWVRQLTREKVLEQVNRGKYVLVKLVQGQYLSSMLKGSLVTEKSVTEMKKPNMNESKRKRRLWSWRS